jgi:hypothetical protein
VPRSIATQFDTVLGMLGDIDRKLDVLLKRIPPPPPEPPKPKPQT